MFYTRNMEKICVGCSQKFETNINSKKYCNKKCATAFNVKAHRMKKKRLCYKCNSVYILPTSKSCKRCSNNLEIMEHCKGMTLKDYREKISVKGKHPSWINSHIRSFNRSWNSVLTEHPCQKCYYLFHVELCHIKPIASYPIDTKLSVINDPNNILVLCRNCHWEFDHELLTLLDIPKRNEIGSP